MIEKICSAIGISQTTLAGWLGISRHAVVRGFNNCYDINGTLECESRLYQENFNTY